MNDALVLVGSAGQTAVALLALRHALRRDRLAWLRERQAELYVDLLTAVSGDVRWIESGYMVLTEKADATWEEKMGAGYRPAMADRWRLEARMRAYASHEVIRLYWDLQVCSNRLRVDEVRAAADANHVRERMELQIRTDLEQRTPRLTRPWRWHRRRSI